MNNCGISRWDDPNEINARLKALTSQPIWEVTDEYYNNVILNYFDEKCKASKAVYEESKEYIPGGVQHNLAFNKPFPMCMARADGAYLYDKDGNQYIDFLQAGGPTILGSNYPVIREKVIELLNECGPVTGLLHESELMIAKEINRHMPNVEMFRMLGSGTESVMAALRIARIATGKKRIIKVGGAYHGWSDQMVYGLKIPGSRALLESHGIPGGCYEATDEVRPNDLTMLEDMLKRNVLLGGTAGVIVEPVGPESGTRPVAHDYNAGVRQIRRADDLRRGRHGLPRRAFGRAGLFRRRAGSDGLRQDRRRRVPVGGRRRRQEGIRAAHGGRSCHRQAPGVCRRHTGGQSSVLPRRVHGHP